ncbi:HAD family hydrolase [Maritalea porphyrae]|uniref:HAD family hydrolase n=1 Tax=Maritalea porphyrae TaxID=880732 RepID=UPI0022AF7C77|nr:HAD family phosphatase [Maritalea porphyrae]MCZ4271778.1 HAD family phosphatase [Maritalea porphyrae]
MNAPQPAIENKLGLWPEKVEAVVFDMDGLLLDTEQIYKRVMQQLCKEWGHELTHEMFAAFVGIPQTENVPIYQQFFGKDFDVQTYENLMVERAHEEMSKGIPVKNGAKELVAGLSARGVPIAVATSTGASAHKHLEEAGLHSYFDTIVTRMDVTKGKPHPEPFLTATSRLGFAPENCIAFEDSHNGVRSASAAGLATVMVPDILDPTDEIAAMCVAILPSLLHFKAEIDHFFGPMN